MLRNWVMKYYRTLALAASFVGGLALPALAQTPAPAPQAENASPLPDAGVKKVMPSPKHHVHHVVHKAVKAAPAKAPEAKQAVSK